MFCTQHSLDSQEAAKWLQMLWRLGMSPLYPHILGDGAQLSLTRPVSSANQFVRDITTILHLSNMNRFMVLQVAVINFKYMHMWLCHTHTSHFLLPTENGTCYLTLTHKCYQKHENLLLHFTMNHTNRVFANLLKTLIIVRGTSEGRVYFLVCFLWVFLFSFIFPLLFLTKEEVITGFQTVSR